MRAVALLTAVFVLASCVHKPPRQPTGLKESEFWKEQTTRSDAVKFLSAKLQLHYQGRSESVRGKGRMLSELPDRMRLELRDPLGRAQYIVAVSGERFTAYYPTQKRAYFDKQSGTAYMKRFLGVGFTFKDLQNLLLGLLPPGAKAEKFDEWGWAVAEEVYRGRLTRDGEKLVVDVDPDTGAIRELTWEWKGDVAHVTYGDFAPCCDGMRKTLNEKPIRLAAVVTVGLDRAASKVEAEWDDVTRLDAGMDSEIFSLALPEGVQKVLLP
jgi:outer membrane biogenesis lipoprotein LolB